MRVGPDVLQSITENHYELSGCWLWSSVDIYSADYREVLQQPASLEATTIDQCRFKADAAVLTVRSGPGGMDPVVFACTAQLLDDPTAPPGSIYHADLLGLLGHGPEYVHPSAAQLSGLTAGDDTALHFHASDRARANHTGTQLAATISDLGTAVVAVTSGLYQPISAELSALAGLSSTGYAKRSGAASWSVVASIPQADVSGLTAALAGLQPLDSDLTAIAALTTTTFGRSLLTVADAAAARTAIGAQVAGSYEPALGNPGTNGWVLSSTAAGVRSWVALPSVPVSSVFGRTGAVVAASGDYSAYYLGLTAQAADSAKLGGVAAASYALASAIPAASSTTPAALGTAAVGAGTTWARADHVHAMPTAAQVGARAALAPASGAWWQGTPIVGADGGTEIGQYLDFHSSSTGASDYDVRLNAVGSGLAITATNGATLNGNSLVVSTDPRLSDARTPIGGPYLPLSAGNGYALTGQLYGKSASLSGTLSVNGSAMPAWGTGLNPIMLGGEAFLYSHKTVYGTQPTWGSNFYYDGTNLKTIATYTNSNYPRALLIDTAGTLSYLISATSPTAGLIISDLGVKFSTDKDGNGYFSGSISRAGYAVWDAGNLPNAASASCTTGNIPVASGSKTFTDSILSQNGTTAVFVKSSGAGMSTVAIASNTDISTHFGLQFASDGTLTIYPTLSGVVQPYCAKFQSNGAFLPKILNINGTFASSNFARYTSSAVRTIDISKVVHIWTVAQGSNNQKIPNGTYSGQLLMLKNLSGNIVLLAGNISTYLASFFGVNVTSWIIWNGSNWE